MLKRFKFTYALYNFFQKGKLVHNTKFYKILGLNKKYYSPISSKDFEGLDENLLKEQNADFQVKETEIFKRAEEETQNSILNFDQKGYLILKKYFTDNQVDEINTAIDEGLERNQLKFEYGNKIMFAIHKLKGLKRISTNPELIEFLSSLLGGEVKLFQSINFIHGSEQKTHSDSIHMTTFPLGGLLGVWIALEDIGMDNGPLHYYPGSHKLPYYLNSDYDNEGSALLLGDKDYTAYEKMIARKIEENKLEKEVFLAKKGDVLVWHANLFHGGEPHLDKSQTRKSMVFHYYMANCICYHEITQRPALLH